MEERKKFRLADVVLSVICVVFVAEAAAPVASIGNSQYFWWVFMMIAFLLPYGMISSELGTTYTGDGGLYDWINKAFPRSKWGARASWYYWINFPLWMASLAVVCPELLGVLTGLQFGWLAKLLIELAFIWIVTWIAFYPVCNSILILNISAAIKMILALTVGVLGIVYVVKNGFVNDMAFRTFLPGFDLHSLSYISVIIFNFLGFEVVCTYADNMRDPKRQIPQAVVTGGIVIALIYLFSAFGIGAAIPTHEISEDSGLIDAVSLMTGRTSGLFVGAVALLFLVTLFGNMISWSMGVNSTAAYAAENGDMPAIFAKRWAKNDMPIGSALTSGIVASVVCILGIIIELLSPDSSLFWSFFALNLVMLLLSYAPVFPAFLRLREIDPDSERPFRVPGGHGMLRVLAYVTWRSSSSRSSSRRCRCRWTARRSPAICRSRSGRSSASSSAKFSSRRVRAGIIPRRETLWQNESPALRRSSTATGCLRSLSRRPASGCSGRSATTTGATAPSPRRKPFWTWPRPFCSLNP